MLNIFKKISVAAVLFTGGAMTAQAEVSFVNPITGNEGPGGKSLGEMISSVMGFFLWVAIFVCPALILWGAFLIATSGGSEEKMKQGKQFITYAAVGLVIILLSNAIRAIIFDVVSAK